MQWFIGTVDVKALAVPFLVPSCLRISKTECVAKGGFYRHHSGQS